MLVMIIITFGTAVIIIIISLAGTVNQTVSYLRERELTNGSPEK